jgi:hypothetical protein
MIVLWQPVRKQHISMVPLNKTVYTRLGIYKEDETEDREVDFDGINVPSTRASGTREPYSGYCFDQRRFTRTLCAL